MLKVDSIIFDFDGVIVESVDIKARAFAHLFKDHPQHVDRIIDYHLVHGGMSRFEKFEWIYRNLLHQPLTEGKKRQLGEQFSGFAYQQVLRCPFVRGAQEALARYSRLMPLFIASGTPEREIRSIVAERGLSKYFKEVYGAPEKKDKLINKILVQYGFSPAAVVMIGDSLDDWQGARDAGVRFIGRETKPDLFHGKKVHTLIRDLSGLEGVING